MTRTTTLALLAVALLASPAPAQDKYDAKKAEQTDAEKEKARLEAADRQWSRLDKNRDGKLRGDEIPDGFTQRFDRDGDEDVEKKEFETVMRRPAGLRRLLVLRDTRARAQSAMRFDQDKDGLVSAEEYPGDRNAFKKADRNKDGNLAWNELLRMASDELADLRKRMKNPSRYEMLDLFDLNRDQQIAKSEYDGPSRAFRKYDVNGDGVVDYYEATGRMRGMMQEEPELEDQSVIASMDGNDDGKVSREEWKGTEAAWMRMDKNGDGWITIADAR